MQRAGRRVTIGAVVLALGQFLLAGRGAAQERLVREFDDAHGLVPPVVALAQDSVGFLWAGTRAGLFRFDGRRFERWARETLPRAVGTIAVAPSGRVVVVDADGALHELSPTGARPLPGRALRSPDHSFAAAFGADGRLWAITGADSLAWLADDGTWHVQPLPPAVDSVRRLFPTRHARGVLVAGRSALWRVDTAGAPHRLLDVDRVVDALERPDGSLVALGVAGDALERTAAGAVVARIAAADAPGRRAIDLAERDGTLWTATDRYLVARTADGARVVLDPDDGVQGGGPLLVDREGSLWHAGFTRLAQYPEPETRTWAVRDGLPSASTRFLGRTGDVLWVTTWQSPGYVARAAADWRADTAHWPGRGELCPDGRGGLLVGTSAGIRRLHGRTTWLVNPRVRLGFGSCAPAGDGALWVGSGDGLYRVAAGGAVVDTVASFPPDGAPAAVEAVLEDRRGRLWAARGERLCGTAAAWALEASARWTCHALPAGIVHVNALAEFADGTLWAASNTMGVLRYAGDRWVPMGANAALPTRSVLNLTPSPRGGVWMVGAGIVQRVRARGDGWEVLERLGAWHGLQSVGAGDLLEEPDGAVWLATARGVVRVPPEVRARRPAPPRTAVVEARIDGRPVPLDSPLVLPAARNRLELRFAALTFRDRTSLRVQVRRASAEAWVEAGGEPAFHLVDLHPGQHETQVRASLDGIAWSATPARLAVRVLPPWYRTWWALTGGAALAAALLVLLYRARTAYLVGLERQRTRIAMDLHDELGSGLASIGILAGVLSAGRGAPDEQHGVARRVAGTAEALGAALSDIVWSLDPQRATLGELAARLAERGDDLFADDVRFDTDFPDAWPLAPLALPVLRQVLLVGLEALHNAARHAGASHVRLTLRPEGDHWLLEVRDDGVGLGERAASGDGSEGESRGRGRRAMRRRAADIGADVAWLATPGGGTTVRLRFATTPRLARRRRRPLARA